MHVSMKAEWKIGYNFIFADIEVIDNLEIFFPRFSYLT